MINEQCIKTDPLPLFSLNGVKVWVLRTDKVDPVISGNKWFKLRFYLKEALDQQKKRLITYGGAYSNHIVATAAACKKLGLPCAGIIRGEEPANYSHTLEMARDYGMNLNFVSRDHYRTKKLPPDLESSENYIIPEGGYGITGAEGAATIPYDKEAFDFVCCAVGTGTMMAGLINAKSSGAEVIGFSILKNNYDLERAVIHLLKDKTDKVHINHDFHFGGYAKYSPALLAFMNDLYAETAIPTDFVYTAKLFYGVRYLLENKFFREGANILIIHCGGLQGNLSLRKGTLIF